MRLLEPRLLREMPKDPAYSRSFKLPLISQHKFIIDDAFENMANPKKMTDCQPKREDESDA